MAIFPPVSCATTMTSSACCAPPFQEFIGTDEYAEHKKKRFRGADNPILAENEAFLLNDKDTRALFERAYDQSCALYYKSQPHFDELMSALADMVAVKGA